MTTATTVNAVRRPTETECDMPEAVLRSLIQKKPPTAEELDPILNAALVKIMEQTGSQAIAYFPFAEGSTRLQIQNVIFSPSLYGDDKAKAALYAERAGFFKSMSVPVVKSSAGLAIMKNQLVTVDDRATADDFYDPIEWAPDFVINALVAVPITAGNKRVAAFEVINKIGDRPARFTEADKHYLYDAAGYMGKLIHRVKHPAATMTDMETAACMARLVPCRLLTANEFQADVNLARDIGERALRNARVFPLCQLSRNSIRAVVSDPFDFLALQDFEVASGFRIEEKHVATPNDIRDAINRLFPGGTHISKVAASISREYVTPVPASPVNKEEEEDENSALIVQLANRIIEDAHRQRASDIHIEPQHGKLVVRYRVDGVCHTALTLPAQAHRPLISRIKIMSELDIAEHRMPQDGRLSFEKFSPTVGIDLRVSVTPSQNGESIVMRILDRQKSALPLSQLGFSAHNLERYSNLIKVPHGMILHCGPTGSGKSMTLFAALNEINSPEWKTLTIEDPIEYTLEGITQVQTKREIGLTFASALRCFLRQDPDIILVGEIRDKETAEIAIEAAMTGHVIFSTLHTNDAPSVIARLTEMDVEPFLLTSTLVCICAQRLMRRLCPKCKAAEDPTEVERKLLACAKDVAEITKVHHARGCNECNQTGYRGRIGIHELIEVNDALKELISKRATTEQLKSCARAHGMHTLFEDAMEKVKAGISSCAEAQNTVRPDV